MVKFESVLINPWLLIVELDDGIELCVMKEPRVIRVSVICVDELEEMLREVARALLKKYQKEIKVVEEQWREEKRVDVKEAFREKYVKLESRIKLLESVLELVEMSGVG